MYDNTARFFTSISLDFFNYCFMFIQQKREFNQRNLFASNEQIANLKLFLKNLTHPKGSWIMLEILSGCHLVSCFSFFIHVMFILFL